jgi:23S rRNA (cytosine1962-C5)-methyltransferase
MPALTLKPDREKSLIRLHPWVFSGAIEKVEGDPAPGAIVDVKTSDGVLIGRGGYSPTSQIIARMWSFDPDETIDGDFLRRRLQMAVDLRTANPSVPDKTCRLVNAESDGLPGLIVDRYGDFIVCQFLSCSVDVRKAELVEILQEITQCAGVYERSDVKVREKEDLPLVAGNLAGDEPPEFITVDEGQRRYEVDVRRGHKTGFYLDQRVNRERLSDYSSGADVLNCFSYTGGFAVSALAGGAKSVTNIDTSGDCLAIGERNVALNGFDPAVVENIDGDVFEVLRRFRDSRRTFDIIVLDPPRFAESKARLQQACRGYKDINLLACKLLRPGGLLMTYSCSGHVAPDLFQKIVSDGALDANRFGQILERQYQPADHPVALNFPEGQYLKGLICRIC